MVFCLLHCTDLQNALNLNNKDWTQTDQYDWYMQIAPVSSIVSETANNWFSEGSTDPTFLSVSRSQNSGLLVPVWPFEVKEQSQGAYRVKTNQGQFRQTR